MPDPPSPSSSTSSFLPTTTLLAIPDGPIASSSKDARSHTTSILGGYPTFPSLPASSSSSSHNVRPEHIKCGQCGNSIPLLTQVYCPPEGGENDRNVYVFACPRGACQRKPNSVRAYRASVRNEVYAADAAEQKAKREAEEAERRAKEKINPFSMGSSAGIGGGLGSTLFGGNADGMPSFNPFSSVAAVEAPTEAFSGLKLGSEGDEKKEKKEDEAKATAPLSTSPSGPSTPPQTLAPPFPAYLPAQYLTTFDEYLPADPNALAGDTAGRVKQLSAGEAEEKERELQQQSGAGSGGKKGAAGGEQWEKVLPKGVDEVFERFLERLNRAEDGSGQVLRYDLGAVPLPYSSNSDLFKRLFKRDAGEDGVDEDDLEPDVNVFGKKYDPTGVVPNCPRCGGERTFEMQLVPGLIAELKTEHLSLTGDRKRRGGNKKKKQQTEEERRRELAVLLGRASAKDLPKPADDGEDERTPVEREEDRLRGETGMEWGTIMVFGCERDCVGFGEEWVGVEWEEMQ